MPLLGKNGYIDSAEKPLDIALREKFETFTPISLQK